MWGARAGLRLASSCRGSAFSVALLAAAVLIGVPHEGVAQAGPGGFSFESLDLPPGFLDLRDVVLVADDQGAFLAMGTTTLMNADTRVLFSSLEAGAGRQRTLALQPRDWSLTESIPALSNPVLDGLTLSNVGLVITERDRVTGSGQMVEEERAFYRDIYKADDFTLVLKPGINLIAAIAPEELPADHPLLMVMNALGIERGAVLLQGTLGRSLSLIGAPGAGGADIIKDLYLRAELPPMHPPGSPAWFRSGQLALELTGDPSVRLVGEVTVNIDDTDLLFFLAASMARTGVSLSGGLQAEDGWQQPFGIPWLVMNGVVAKIGITAAGSIQLGFAGDMVIGEKDIDVAVAVALNAATGVPTNFIFDGESDAGFGLSDLVMLQTRMAAARQTASSALGSGGDPQPAIPLDALPTVDFRDIGLKFAPKPEPDLGIERGMAIKGRLWLPVSADGELTDFAGVDVAVSEDGLWARGDLGAFELGPLVWQDAALDLTATREDQHFLVKGEVELMGARQLVDVSFQRTGFSFRTETRLHDMFTADISAMSEFDLRQPKFQVDAVAHADFADVLGPLVQQGVERYAEAGADVIAAARVASDAAGVALANSQASLAELRRVLEAQRQAVASTRSTALAAANRARSVMTSALAARNRAYYAYRNTPTRQFRLKAQRLAAYRSAHRTYLIRAVAYNAAQARFATADRIYRAIPPTDQRVAVMAAAEAIARLREQLETMQANLATIEAQYRRITDALARGEQLLLIERAEFHAGLEAAMRGEAIQWGITGAFAGEPFQVEETLDFSNVGSGAAGLVTALLQR